jgi:N-alpha-acetyltransferase 30
MLEAEKATNELARLSLSENPSVATRGDTKPTGNCGDDHVACAGESSIVFVDYRDESQLSAVMSLVGRDLSEPYSSTFHTIACCKRDADAALTHVYPLCIGTFRVEVFTYRYFLYRFPNLCILAVDEDTNEPIGCVVAKIDVENASATQQAFLQEDLSFVAPTSPSDGWGKIMTGYIGMLAVSQSYRRRGIGKALVEKVIQRMKDIGCTSVTLETEVTNLTAQRLYEDIFGFMREELLVRYYLNWNDAYRLRLWFSEEEE